MVFYIRAQNGITDDANVITKMMFNIEHNKNIYKLDGILTSAEQANKSFNVYTHQKIDYEFSVSVGVLLVYCDNDIMAPNVISRLLTEKFRNLGNGPSLHVPVKYGRSNSTTYTLLLKKPDEFNTNISTTSYGSSYRKIITSICDFKRCRDTGSKFIWLVQVISRNPYLHIAEFSQRNMDKLYLSRSISTIIYDAQNMFNIQHGTKQLDYPYITQYTMFSNGQILKEPIYISNTIGLDYEILKCYIPDLQFDYCLNNQITHDIVNSCEYEIRRRNPNKKWHIQLAESYDYTEQEDLESKIEENGKPPFPLDVCFITGTPLYDHAYMIKVQKTNEEKISSYIYVHKLLPHVPFKHKFKTILFKDYLQKNGFRLISTYIVKIERSEEEAISMISNKKINPLKRDIMISISTNGALYDQNIHGKLYTANIEKNVIYVGIMNMNTIDIADYQKTNTILFNARIEY